MKPDIKKLLIGGGIVLIATILIALCCTVREGSSAWLLCKEQIGEDNRDASMYMDTYKIGNTIYARTLIGPGNDYIDFSCKLTSEGVIAKFGERYSQSTDSMFDKVIRFTVFTALFIEGILLILILYYLSKRIYFKWVSKTDDVQKLGIIKHYLLKRILAFLLVFVWLFLFVVIRLYMR